MDRKRLRQAIANWRIISTSEDADKIYLTQSLRLQLQDLLQGSSFLILGRKGVGKSALLHKLQSERNSDASIRKYEFDPELIKTRLQYFDSEFSPLAARRVFELDFMLLACEELSLQKHLTRKQQRAANSIAKFYSKIRPIREVRRAWRNFPLIRWIASYVGLLEGRPAKNERITAKSLKIIKI